MPKGKLLINGWKPIAVNGRQFVPNPPKGDGRKYHSQYSREIVMFFHLFFFLNLFYVLPPPQKDSVRLFLSMKNQFLFMVCFRIGVEKYQLFRVVKRNKCERL
jgi:hypothetical protein